MSEFTYRRKVAQVEAFQVPSKDEVPVPNEAPLPFWVYTAILAGRIKVDSANSMLRVTTASGPEHALPGDYITKDDSDRLDVLTEASFNEDFEKVD